MKTLIKTVTIVSIATLTTANSYFNFSSRFNSTTQDATPIIDIYFPSEENIQAAEKSAYLNKETNAKVSGNLVELVKFNPRVQSSSLDLPTDDSHKMINPTDILVNAAAEKTVDQLVHFSPSTLEFNEQSLIENMVSFKPSEIDFTTIEEPVSIDQLIKYNPEEYKSEDIIEPVIALDQLIRFSPSEEVVTSIEEPVTVEDLVKFNLNVQEHTTIEEPVGK